MQSEMRFYSIFFRSKNQVVSVSHMVFFLKNLRSDDFCDIIKIFIRFTQQRGKLVSTQFQNLSVCWVRSICT